MRVWGKFGFLVEKKEYLIWSYVLCITEKITTGAESSEIKQPSAQPESKSGDASGAVVQDSSREIHVKEEPNVGNQTMVESQVDSRFFFCF